MDKQTVEKMEQCQKIWGKTRALCHDPVLWSKRQTRGDVYLESRGAARNRHVRPILDRLLRGHVAARDEAVVRGLTVDVECCNYETAL